MGTIKILTDASGFFKPNTTIKMYDFLSWYFKNKNHDSISYHLYCIPMPSAVAYIAEKLGITYEFV